MADFFEHLFYLWTVPLPLLLALSASKLLILVIYIFLSFEKALLDGDHVTLLRLPAQVIQSLNIFVNLKPSEIGLFEATTVHGSVFQIAYSTRSHMLERLPKESVSIARLDAHFICTGLEALEAGIEAVARHVHWVILEVKFAVGHEDNYNI